MSKEKSSLCVNTKMIPDLIVFTRTMISVLTDRTGLLKIVTSEKSSTFVLLPLVLTLT